MIKILTYSTLFPNHGKPTHGIFVETRLRHLVASGKVEARVVAPVPWFPSSHPCFGRYSQYADIAFREQRHGLKVYHPKYPVIPKIGMTVAPMLLALATFPVVKKIKKNFDFQIIDAHYFYPDGVAAALLARWLGIPLVITARGTDINLISQYVFPGKMIRWAAARAATVITVCQALQKKLLNLQVPQGKIVILRNGVDLQLFTPPENKAELKKQYGLTGLVFLSVGNLVKNKGHHLVIHVLTHFPAAQLYIIGDGPEKNSLEKLAEQLKVQNRVHFPGRVSQSELAKFYGAADALVLASGREGWPNVLLEALACGTPVVACKTGGIPEVITSPVAGILIEKRSSDAIATALKELLLQNHNSTMVRMYAEKFSWDAVTQGQLEIFRNILFQK